MNYESQEEYDEAMNAEAEAEAQYEQESAHAEYLESLINIGNTDFYEHSKPELKERTKKRLTEIAECGMSEVGIAHFGYKGAMSGLYIEKVWSYSDKDFIEYMDWARGLIQKSLKNNKS